MPVVQGAAANGDAVWLASSGIQQSMLLLVLLPLLLRLCQQRLPYMMAAVVTL